MLETTIVETTTLTIPQQRKAPTRKGAIPVEGVVQHYAWGSQTAIPELLGKEENGTPWAELWLGTHPAAPATTRHGGKEVPLTEIVTGDGRGGLPYLLKVLAAEETLSLQVHPTIAQAVAGYEREEAAGIALDSPHRNYRDRNHKPELIVALTPFRALAGIRDPRRTLQVVEKFGREVQEAYTALREQPNGTGALAVLEMLLQLPAEEGAALAAAAERAAEEILADGDAGPDTVRAADLVQTLTTEHPGDVGAVVALLLNDVTLAPGEGLYQAAGSIHAYVKGVGVEVMAASDNVLRGGLTCKHVDVVELSATIDPTPETPHLVQPRQVQPGVTEWPVPVDDFVLEKVTVTPGAPIEMASEQPGILLTLEGDLEVDGLHRTRGEAAYLPEGRTYQIRGHGNGYRVTSRK